MWKGVGDDVFNVELCVCLIALRRRWLGASEVLNFIHGLFEFAHEELVSCEWVHSCVFASFRTLALFLQACSELRGTCPSGRCLGIQDLPLRLVVTPSPPCPILASRVL